MKSLMHKSLMTILIFTFSTHSWANEPEIISAVKKVKVSKEESNELLKLSKALDEKQLKVVNLINVVGSIANDRFSLSSEMDKEVVETAYNGFIARFQNIREDREALERKEISPDRKALEDYSLRLNQLMDDLHTFLNKN